MPRKKSRDSRIPGLVRRNARAYYSRLIPEAVGGDRIFRSLDSNWGSEQAMERAAAVNSLWSRGDWAVLRRWAAGEVHITELLRAVREGDYGRLKRLNADGLLLGKAVEAHLRRIEATSAHQTFVSHRVVCEGLIETFGADFPMHQFTTPMAEAFLHKPRENGEPWAPRTQNLYRTKAGALWRWAIEREAEEAEQRGLEATLRQNPWRRAKIREARRKRPQVLTEAELYALINHPAVAGTPTQALLAIAGYAGLRAQEITNLRVDQDVHLGVPKLIVQAREGEHTWETKTERSVRDVRIPPVLAGIIRRHIERGFAGVRYLFRAPGRDQPIHRATARTWTKDAFTAAGILYGEKEGEGLTLHSLRHSHATILLSRGVSLAAVADRLGDTQEEVLKTYSHALPDDHERALQILEQLARGPITQGFVDDLKTQDSTSPSENVQSYQQEAISPPSDDSIPVSPLSLVKSATSTQTDEVTDQQKTPSKRPYSGPKLTKITSPPAGVVFAPGGAR